MNLNIHDTLSGLYLLLRSRVEVIFLWSWSAAIACLIAGKGFPPLQSTILVILATILVTISVYTYNDIIDAEMDKMNKLKVNKPLVKGVVSPTLAKIVVILSAVSGLSLSYFVSLQTFVICFTWFVIFFLYSYPQVRFKKVFIVKEVTSSSGQIFTALMGGYSVSSAFNPGIIFAGIAFWVFTFLGVPAFADTLDAKEDQAYGMKTLGAVLSWKRKIQLMGVGCLFMMTITPLTYIQLGFSVLLPITTIILSLIVLRWGVYPAMNQYSDMIAIRGRRLFTAYLLITQIVFILSSMNLGSLLFP